VNESDPFDGLMGGNYTKIADYSEVGMSHHGVLLDAYKQQARKFDPANPGKGPLQYWSADRKPTEKPNPAIDGGDPIMETHMVFQTDEHEDEDDDGRREIWLNKKPLLIAMREAVIEAGAKQPERGGWWRVTRIDNLPPKYRGGNPPRGWHVMYKTPEQYAATGPAPAPVRRNGVAAAPEPESTEDPWAVSAG
jgi:hypothetical protein